MSRRSGARPKSIVEEIRAEVQARDFVRVGDEELARLTRVDAEGEHNDAIEGIFAPEVSALFAMLREERVPLDERRYALERFLASLG